MKIISPNHALDILKRSKSFKTCICEVVLVASVRNRKVFVANKRTQGRMDVFGCWLPTHQAPRAKSRGKKTQNDLKSQILYHKYY